LTPLANFIHFSLFKITPTNVIDSSKPQTTNGYVDIKFLTTNGECVSTFRQPSNSNEYEAASSMRSRNMSSLAPVDESIVISTAPVNASIYTTMLDKKSKNVDKADLDISGMICYLSFNDS
jgi:hypothetical protein